MADHVRQQIREFVVAALKDVAALENVVDSRIHNFSPGDLPAAAIYTLREISARDTLAAALKRELTLAIDVHLAGGDALDDEADALCLAIEAALAADTRMNRLALESSLASTEIGFSGEGERRLGLVRLTYRVTYRTRPDGSPA